MVTIKNLTKSYGAQTILNNTSYTFPSTGLVCLLGPSGGGKSTLLNLIAGFDTAFEGQIVVSDTDLSNSTEKELCAYRRDTIGFVFQNYHLLKGYSSLENVTILEDISPEKNKKQKGIDLLSRLGLLQKTNETIENLSGGQKQRVAIARALMNDPALLLADEPTGALDRSNSEEIMKLLKEISFTRLVIVVTHDAKVCEYADCILRLMDGKITEEKVSSKNSEAITTKSQMSPSEYEENTTGNNGFVIEHSYNTKPIQKNIPNTATPSRKTPLWKRAKKNFSVHFLRYLCVSIALAIGIGSFLLSLSSRNLMAEGIEEFKNKNTAFQNGYIKLSDDKSPYEELKSHQSIEQVYYQYKLKDVILTYEGHQEVLAEKYPTPKASEGLSYGTMPRKGENEIAITPSLAKKLDQTISNLLGEKIELTYQGKQMLLTICGIYNASYDDFIVSSDLEQSFYQALTDEKPYSLTYDVTDFYDIIPIHNFLEEQGYEIKDTKEEASAFLRTFENITRLFFVISLLILLTAFFLSIILLNKLQHARQREVGLLSALGYTKSNIKSMLTKETLLFSTLTTSITLLFLLVTQFVCKTVGFPLFFTTLQILLTLGCTYLLVLALNGFFSYQLTRIEPANALRS